MPLTKPRGSAEHTKNREPDVIGDRVEKTSKETINMMTAEEVTVTKDETDETLYNWDPADLALHSSCRELSA